MVLLDGDLRVVLGHAVGAAVPPGHADRNAVALGRHIQLLARARGSLLEGELQHAVGTEGAHHRLLHHDLALGSGVHHAAQVGVFALGVLAHDEEVDLARLSAGQGAGHALEQAHRAQVDVLVEFAPELEQAAPQRDVVGHCGRPADGAEQDGVLRLELRLPVGRHHLARPGVIVAAGPVDRREVEPEAELLLRHLQRAQRLGHHFLADAVARDDGDAVRAGGGGVHGGLSFEPRA